MTPPNVEEKIKPDPAVWTRSVCLALSQQSCTYCFGLGLRGGRNEKATPCNCVFRAVFRACYAHFRQCGDVWGAMSQVHYNSEIAAKTGPRKIHGYRREEYCADFILVAKRVLTEQENQLFRFHFLLGADWKQCARRLKIDRGLFFHAVYRIQQKLGLVYGQLRPYRLFPPAEYNTPGLETPTAQPSATDSLEGGVLPKAFAA
jgi:hypothetical protein